MRVQVRSDKSNVCGKRVYYLTDNSTSSSNNNDNNNNNNNNNRDSKLCSWMQVSALPEGNVCTALTLSGIAECILVYSDFYYEAETGLTLNCWKGVNISNSISEYKSYTGIRIKIYLSVAAYSNAITWRTAVALVCPITFQQQFLFHSFLPPYPMSIYVCTHPSYAGSVTSSISTGM